MAIEINDGSVRINVGYSLKIPHQVQYSSQDAHVGLSIEAPYSEAASVEDITEEALTIQAELITAAKTAVFAQLGVEFDVTNGGILLPLVEEPKRNQASSNGGRPARRSQSRGSSSGRGGGGSRSRSSSSSKAPIVEIDGVKYYDQRPLIDSGEYKQGAATFRAVRKDDAEDAGLQAQYWLYSKSGDMNDDVADLLENNDIDF